MNRSWTSQLELERQLYRADAEVAQLRLLVKQAAKVIGAFPGLTNSEIELLAELERQLPA